MNATNIPDTESTVKIVLHERGETAGTSKETTVFLRGQDAAEYIAIHIKPKLTVSPGPFAHPFAGFVSDGSYITKTGSFWGDVFDSLEKNWEKIKNMPSKWNNPTEDR